MSTARVSHPSVFLVFNRSLSFTDHLHYKGCFFFYRNYLSKLNNPLNMSQKSRRKHLKTSLAMGVANRCSIEFLTQGNTTRTKLHSEVTITCQTYADYLVVKQLCAPYCNYSTVVCQSASTRLTSSPTVKHACVNTCEVQLIFKTLATPIAKLDHMYL